MKPRAIDRMERLKKLKENGHGRYDEIMEEKVVLQTTMYVSQACLDHKLSNFSLEKNPCA